MKITRKIVLIAALTFVLCIGIAMADTGVPQVPETQGFVTSTAMSAVGTVTETDNIVSQISGNYGGLPPAILPLYCEYETIYTGTYSENTIADQGLVTYTKGIGFDTSGAATQGLYNLQTNKLVEFVGLDTGRMTSEESTVLDGAGTAIEDQEIMICPFASIDGSLNPPFCNIVEEGSSVDLTLGSLTTATVQRYIMLKGNTEEYLDSNIDTGGWDLPVSDPGVESDYSIKLTGFGDVPAMGSATAFINAHIQEAREAGLGRVSAPKAEDLVYSEYTTAAGDITLFQKVMSYDSKITAPGVLEI
jgi:hypothetical protein